MKRIFSAVCMTILLFMFATSAFAASYTESNGTISAVSGDQITVKLADGSELIFNVNSATTFIDSQSGSSVALSSVSVGDSFRAFYSAATTRSVPAQAYLHTMLLVKAGTESFFHDFTVASVDVSHNNVTLLNEGGSLILTIPANVSVKQLGDSGWTQLAASSIKPGAKLIAHYGVVASSYPGQASSSNVFMLKNGSGVPVTPVPPITNTPVTNVPATGSATGLLIALPLLISAAAAGLLLLRLKRDSN